LHQKSIKQKKIQVVKLEFFSSEIGI